MSGSNDDLERVDRGSEVDQSTARAGAEPSERLVGATAAETPGALDQLIKRLLEEKPAAEPKVPVPTSSSFSFLPGRPRASSAGAAGDWPSLERREREEKGAEGIAPGQRAGVDSRDVEVKQEPVDNSEDVQYEQSQQRGSEQVTLDGVQLIDPSAAAGVNVVPVLGGQPNLPNPGVVSQQVADGNPAGGSGNQPGSADASSSSDEDEEEMAVPRTPEQLHTALVAQSALVVPNITEAQRAAIRDEVVTLLEDIAKIDKGQIAYGLLNTVARAILDAVGARTTPLDVIDDLEAVRQSVRDPPIAGNVRAAAAENVSAIASKMTSCIPKFDGKSDKYPWVKFYTSYKIAVSNASYRPDELKAIFLGCLEGEAFDYYMANQDEFSYLRYPELVARFEQRFDVSRRVSVNSLVGIHQKSGEDVLTFRDRLINAARPLMPPPIPKRQKYVMTNGDVKNLENPQFDQLNEERRVALRQHDLYLTKFFVAGVKQDILGRLTTTEFARLSDAVDAAKVAEDYLLAVNQIRNHHIRLNANVDAEAEQPSTNALTALKEMDQRGSGRKPRGATKQTAKKGPCHNCGKPGHWKDTCTQRPRSRSGDRVRSSSRDRKGSSVDVTALMQGLEKLIVSSQRARTPSKGRKRSDSSQGRRSRSHSRGRSPFRGSAGQSRPSSRGSTYNGKSRSNSKN